MFPSFDASASVRIWAVEATLGGRQLRVPPLPASEWLPLFFEGKVLGIRELLEDFDLREALREEAFTFAEFKEKMEFMAEVAAGRPWLSAYAIAGAAANRWDVIGSDLARAGVRFDQIPLGGALDAMYASLLRHMDEAAQQQFIRLVKDGAPPKPKSRAPKNAKPLPSTSLQYVQTRPKTQLRRPQDRPDAPTEPPRPPLRPRAGSAPRSGVSGSPSPTPAAGSGDVPGA